MELGRAPRQGTVALALGSDHASRTVAGRRRNRDTQAFPLALTLTYAKATQDAGCLEGNNQDKVHVMHFARRARIEQTCMYDCHFIGILYSTLVDALIGYTVGVSMHDPSRMYLYTYSTVSVCSAFVSSCLVVVHACVLYHMLLQVQLNSVKSCSFGIVWRPLHASYDNVVACGLRGYP